MTALLDTYNRYDTVADVLLAIYGKRDGKEALLVYPAEVNLFVSRIWGTSRMTTTLPADPNVRETAIALWEPAEESLLHTPAAAVEAAVLVHAK